MQVAKKRDPMHPYVLIPLLSSIAAAALAAAVWVRDPTRPANRLVGAMLVAAAWWSLFQTLWNTADSAEAAVRLARWSNCGSLWLAPLSLHAILSFRPAFDRRARAALAFTYAAALTGAVVSVATPTLVADAIRTGWGWAPVGGPAGPFVFAALVAAPLWAIGSSFRHGRRAPTTIRREMRWIQSSVALPFAVSSLTEFLLPAAGIEFPRLGCASLIVWGGAVWWMAYRFRMPILSPQRFARQILATLPNGVMLVRTDGRIRMTNQALDQLIGGEPRAALGLPIQELLEGDELAGAGERPCALHTDSGERIPVSVSTSPLADADGDTVGYVLALRDLREVVSLRSRLLNSGRLAAVGQLAAGIAHEINNPVAYVRSNLSMLQRHWAGMPERLGKSADGPAFEPVLGEGAELLRESVEGIDRIASIVRDVGGFARRGPAEREMADVSELLDTAVRVAAPQLRGSVEVEREYAPLPRVACVPRELMQVFVNLLLNAAQSVGREGSSGGTIRLVTRAQPGRIEVRVEDDGPGIDPQDVERLFDPFFTTKPVGEGTGLGLAISQQIVERHGGDISYAPRSGGGAVFRVRIPASEGEGGG